MQRLQFGKYSADVDDSHCSCLYRGRVPIGLSDVPRKVLFHLLRRRPRPVLAKLLLKELWHPGANPSNLAKQVRALRAALGDAHSHRYIRTVKKEGYAFVMPVIASNTGVGGLPVPAPVRTGAAPLVDASVVMVSADAVAIDPLSKAEWRLARDKLLKDLRGSCLHHIERLGEAIEECHHRIQLIADRRGISLDGRFPREPPLLLPPRPLGLGTPSAKAADEAARNAAAALIQYARTHSFVVNVGAYAPACLAVLQSLRRRSGLEVRALFEELSGRQQILRLFHDDEADFLFAPHAPFLLVGDHGALDYRWLTPIHSYEQILLRIPGATQRRRRRLLVYKGGSPEEQLMTGVGIPPSAVPEMLGSMESLLAAVQSLDPGDMVLAWEPLASGLESRRPLLRQAQFRCWQSLYCHKRWQRGALRALKDQFRRLFASEWIYCRSNVQWTIECLAVELRALEFFTAGSGLGPAP